jgi:hypothetical protein
MIVIRTDHPYFRVGRHKVAAGSAMQLGSRIPKMHAHDSAAVVGKGCTRLTSVVVTIKAGITYGHATTMQRQPP